MSRLGGKQNKSLIETDRENHDINYFPAILSFLMYADDTTIYFNLEDFSSLNREYEINRELEKVNTWFQLNKLTLNVEKTKCMLFHKRRTVNPIHILLNNKAIDIVPQFNYLGIILDEHLSWKAHVAMVTGKLSKINGILNRLNIFIFHKYYLQYISLYLFHTLIMVPLFGAKIMIP